ncbi:MAG: AMP-binding protein [Cyanobacteria bacterium P01_F01_bin.116]
MVARCRHCCSLYVAPATEGAIKLHYTIPDLLDLGCSYGDTPALHQGCSHGWETYSYREFRTVTEELALGFRSWEWLLSESAPGSVRIGLFLESDLDWIMADMSSLLAGWVTVPLDAGYPAETINWIIQDAGVQVLVVSGDQALERFSGALEQIKLIVTVAVTPDSPEELDGKSQGCVITTLDKLRSIGHRLYSSEAVQSLKAALYPKDLATIVYTADADGIAKGALLSHGSITGNIWAAFSSMPGLVRGEPEIALSFLPLNHIFARTFLYGHFGFGHDIYFSSPKRVFRHLSAVKPTIFITVPRLLEKIYERVNHKRQQAPIWQRFWLNWCWNWAHQYQVEHEHWLWYHWQRWLLGHGVYKTLREAFGGRVRYLLSGGAALEPEVMTFFNAVGVPVKQGYGLTETSSVLSYTRDRWLRSGTVGTPIPGVEMRLADDGEVMVKTPYLMAGYHHNPLATQTVIDENGWFHTGDFGEFSEDGVLTLRGCKKELFKLSTGKYVAPGPIESQLQRSSLVRQALLVGPGQKFCGVLIIPERSECDVEDLQADYQALMARVNAQLAHWSTIKRFLLVKPKGRTGHSRVQRYQVYAQEIQALYRETDLMSKAAPRRFWEWRSWESLYQRDRRVNVV